MTCRPALWCLLAPAALAAQTPTAPTPVAAATRDSTPVAITHVTVIDVERGRRLPGHTVLVAGRRVRAAGPDAAVRVPAGARVIDGRGKYLIPGLWDMHVHVSDPDIPGPPELVLPLFVATGVTGVRDMGSASLDTILRLRAEVREGARIGPRMVVAGKIIDGAPLVFPPDELLARTPEEGRRAVDSLADRGVDFIKAYEMLRRDVFLAVLDEARRRGLPVAGHVPLTVDAAEASDSGMRSFEHLRNIDLACSARADSLREARAATLEANAGYAGGASEGTAAWSAGYGAGEKVRRDIHLAQRRRALDTEDPSRCAALLARLARNGTRQTATLFIQSEVLDAERQARLGPTLRYVPGAYRERWERGAASFAALPAARLAGARRWQSWEAALVRRLADAGVPLLAGTDASVASVVPGFGLHEELDALVRLGNLTPLQALRAATLEPARFLGATDSLGTVAAGKLADLVLLDADPLADIRNTQKTRAVVVNGRLLDRVALDALLTGAERAAYGAPGAR
jgi:imidazolonepropionase-like amidohydrolase